MKMKIEKIIDPNIDPVGAAEQTRNPWVSVSNGPWIVTGTSSTQEGLEFIAEFLDSITQTKGDE